MMNKRRYSRRYTQAEIIRNRIFVLLFGVLLLSAVAWGVNVFLEKRQPPSSPSRLHTEQSSREESSLQQSGLGEQGDEEETSTASQPAAGERNPDQKESSDAAAANSRDQESEFYEPEMPMLVNPTNRIPEDYVPDVADMGNGYRFDRKATRAYHAMLKAANEDGINLWVVSAYRDTAKQTANFENKVKEYKAMGYSVQEAYSATAKIIAVPGTSEHSLGLALDLNSLEQDFEHTEAYRWLVAHCADYGFILRYPKDKEDITEIVFEPWHYRYVGVNHAKIMMEKGICLEEYLSGTY